MKISIIGWAASTILVMSTTGCIGQPDGDDGDEASAAGSIGESQEENSIGEATSAITTGLHGAAQKAKATSGLVVSEYLAKQLSQNVNHDFWWFCGQSATATAINFARNTTLTDTQKIGQLQWFHDRLLSLYPGSYTLNNTPEGGDYAAQIYWLYSLMNNEKSNEFTNTWLTTGNRETIKSTMTQHLDGGAYIVALNKTDGGAGHFLTVYAIDYQPQQSGGGTVYFGDSYALPGKLGTMSFTTFLDRMLSQSTKNLYNAFAVKKK